MYNQQLKEEFIKSYTTRIGFREACVKLFNAFERYEQRWGADLCTQPAEVLQPVVVEVSVGVRSTSIRLRFSILQDYVGWCLKNNVEGACDGMLHVSLTGGEKMSTQTVTSPLHLQVYMNQIFEPESEETTDNIYRCFYWLAYGGVPEETILKIKTSDVDFTNMLVRHNGSEFPIYREAIPAFKNCVYLTQFVYKHPNYSPGKVVYKSRADGDTLVRGLRMPTINVMRVEFSRRSKKAIETGKTKLHLSYYRVWISGLFYRMYERERAGLPVDFSDAAAQFMEGKTYKLDSGRNTAASYQRKIAKGYLQDYENWKLSFR